MQHAFFAGEAGLVRHCARNLVISWTLSAASPMVLAGQAIPDRRFLDSVLTEARAAVTADDVPALTRCDGRDQDVALLCAAAIAIYHSPLARKREEIYTANELALRAVFARDRWQYAWYLLGLVRLRLAHDKVVPQEGPALPTGASNELGGINALILALELDPAFAAAAEALALAPGPPDGPDAQAPRLAMLRRVRALLSPAAIAAAAAVERDAGSVDSAIALERRALAAGGVDSGVVFLSLARNFYRANRPAEGYAALIAGSRTLTGAGRAAYRAQLAWVATPQELVRWDSLAPDHRPGWLAGFWSKRDAAEGRPPGSRLIEHYRRVEYAMDHFRIASAEGPPLPLTFVQPNEYRPERDALAYAAAHADLCPETARFVSDATTIGAASRQRYFHPAQDVVDDRGTVWIRHGAPTQVRQTNTAEGAEIWRYERAEGPLVLHFRAAALRGSGAASVLVPSLLTLSPGMRNQVCELDPSICSRLGVTGPLQPGDTVLLRSSIEVGACENCLPPVDPVTHRAIRIPPGVPGMKMVAQLSERCRDPIARVLEREVHAEGTLLNTGAILRARDRGREQIDLATTTDSYRRDFARAVHPAVQVLGLERAGGGAPRLVVAFALPTDDLVPAIADSTPRRTTYPVRVQLMIASVRDGERIDVDTARQLPLDGTPGRGRFISGLVELAVPPGVYAVGLVFTQPDGRGATARVTDVAVPGDASSLELSDLVLGRSNSGLDWNSGAAMVALNPVGSYPKGGNADAYFQVSGMTPGATYQTRFDVFRSDDDLNHAPRLAVSSAQVAAAGRIEVSRTLGLQQLDPGRYRVKLTVSGNGHERSTVAWLTIVK